MQATHQKRFVVDHLGALVIGLGIAALVVVGLAAANNSIDVPFTGDDSAGATSRQPAYDQAAHIRMLEQDLVMEPAPLVLPDAMIRHVHGLDRQLASTVPTHSNTRYDDLGIVKPTTPLKSLAELRFLEMNALPGDDAPPPAPAVRIAGPSRGQQG